jgi:dUTP pyrophosphatase
MNIPIKFKKLHKDAVIPEYKTEGAACVDLVITEIKHEATNLVTVKFGFATNIPVGYRIDLQPRSSFSHKGWIMANSPGKIDSDYTGEWQVKFEAIPYWIDDDSVICPSFPYQIGERAVQASIHKIDKMEFEVVEKLEVTKRGSGGFGSTGLK